MKKVAIFDLRMNDAWDVDWCLVVHSLIHSENMNDIMYFDRCGDPVYFNGDIYEAQAYYDRYCENKGLTIVPYCDMERYELESLELKR